MTLLVQSHIAQGGEGPWAVLALVGLLVGVNPPDVRVHVVLLAERLLAVLAYVRFLAGMDPEVLLVRSGRGESLEADVTLVALLTRMCPQVHGMRIDGG